MATLGHHRYKIGLQWDNLAGLMLANWPSVGYHLNVMGGVECNRFVPGSLFEGMVTDKKLHVWFIFL